MPRANRSLGLDRKILEYGTLTDGGAATSTLTDGRKDWTTNIWAGCLLLLLTGRSNGTVRTILSNTATALTLSANTSGAVRVGNTYAIVEDERKGLHNITVRAASGALTAGETSTPVTGLDPYAIAVVKLSVTTITTPDADDEVDFYLQTSYDRGTTWSDIENVHFALADNGTTAAKLFVVGPPQSSAVSRADTDGALADNTKLDLPLSDRIRFKTAVAGATAPTYAYTAVASFKILG